MPTTRYKNTVAPGGSGDAGTLTNPWLTESSMATSIASDDEALSYGPETLSSSATFNNSGTKTAWIRIIGTNASYVVDGTITVIDGNSSAIYGMDLVGGYYYVENYEWKNCTTVGCDASSGTAAILVGCIGRSNPIGIQLRTFCYAYRCQGISNTTGFKFTKTTSSADYCVASGGTTGFQLLGNCLSNFLAYDCTNGVAMTGASSLINFTVDDCTIGIGVGQDDKSSLVDGIISNCTTGVDMFSGFATAAYASNMAYYNNGTDISHTNLYHVMGDTNTDITLSSDPYTDQSSRDYTITQPNSDLIDVAIVLNASNTSYTKVGGVKPPAPSGTVPTFVGHTGAQFLTDNKLVLKFAQATSATNIIGYISTSPITYASGERAGMVAGDATQMIIANEADGTPLVPGTLYYFATRAINITSSDQDSNTVTGSYTCAGRGNNPLYIKNTAGH